MMLQSLKLRADKLTGIAGTDAAAAATTTLPSSAVATAAATAGSITANPATTLPTPVAHAQAHANANTNGNAVFNLTNNNANCNNSTSNNSNNLPADNNNLNNIHQLHQQQQQQYQAAKPPPPTAATTTTAPNKATAITSATAKSFHPYLRPATAPTATAAAVGTGNSIGIGATAASLSLGTGASISLSPSLFRKTLLPNQINSIAARTTPPSPTATTTATGTTIGSNSIAAAVTPCGLLTLPTTPAAAATTTAGNTANSPNSCINTETLFTDSRGQLAYHFQPDMMSIKTELEPMHMQISDDTETDPDENAMIETAVVRFISPDDGPAQSISNPFRPNNNNNNNNNLNGDTTATNDELAKDEPDPDNIKMFVGQIPKSWDETQLRKMFELYGRVHTLNVLRDKVTSVSRGCCFVTYYTRKAALKAQDALHNIKTLEGMHHPIQMKPADSENRNERKLFVGMLNKKYNEADVRQLFSGHGIIEECTVLRDQNGQSKGCAFVTFATKQNAVGAIKSLHQSQTMEGCSAPIVVKFADTQKEKDQKKIQQLQASICGITALTTPATGSIAGMAPAPTNGLNAATTLMPASVSTRNNPSMAAALAAVSAQPSPQAVNTATALVPTSAALSVPQSLLTASSPQQSTHSYLTTADAMNASAAAQIQLFQQLQAYGIHPAQYLQGLNFPPDHSVTATTLSAMGASAGGATAGNTNVTGSGLLAAPPMSMQNLVTLATLNAHHAHAHAHHAQAHPHNSVASAVAASQTSQSMSAANAQAQHHAQMAHFMAAQQSAAAAAAAQPMTAAHLTGATTASFWPGADSLTSPYAQALNPLTNGTYAAATAGPMTTTALQAAAAGVAGKQIEGPEGSNLFIYHLPQEFTDTDLASTFLPFGNVLSAKVFIDKQTNLSKCFGFVSYDNPHSANAAIQAMHGFQIGTKRLKVQLKRSKDAAKPY